MARERQYLIRGDDLIEVEEGTVVVFDPTGRDLDDDLVVGRVVKCLIRDEDGDPCALVRANGDGGVWAVTEVRAVL
jgi:hypothetical protein